MSSDRRMTCATALETFHRVLDGDLMDAADRQAMEAHLQVCSGCAEQAGQLREVQDILRGMAEQPMPGDAVEEVWRQTVRAPRVRTRRGWRDWRFATAAAIVAAAVLIGLQTGPFDNPQNEEQVARQAAEEARMVLQLTANALKRTEEVAFREVFAEEVSPALQRVGILWPRRSRDRNADEGQI